MADHEHNVNPLSGLDDSARSSLASGIALERYRFVVQQIHTINENVYRFFAIYQTLMTAIIGAQLVLFVNYKRWYVAPSFCRLGLIGLASLGSLVAACSVLFITIGTFAWYDYRKEECELTDWSIGKGFRDKPNAKHWYRWYETYIVSFMLASIGVLWILTIGLFVPAVK